MKRLSLFMLKDRPVFVRDGPSWCEAAIYYADEDVVTSEPYNSFYNHWVCQTANATYHLYMGVADTE